MTEERRPDAIQVTDVRALRALAHPLRLRLLGHLRLHGPATASGLGRAVGESSGATSYHLRQLAAHGFVEEVEQGTARERWWRARHRMTSWQRSDLEAQEGGAEVRDAMAHLQVEMHGRVLRTGLEQQERLGQAWADAGSMSDDALQLTPDQARALTDELDAVVTRWMDAHPGNRPAEGTELVFVLADVVPVAEWQS
jgi:DNA-binding transcriptional ArsR family regulator